MRTGTGVRSNLEVWRSVAVLGVLLCVLHIVAAIETRDPRVVVPHGVAHGCTTLPACVCWQRYVFIDDKTGGILSGDLDPTETYASFQAEVSAFAMAFRPGRR